MRRIIPLFIRFITLSVFILFSNFSLGKVKTDTFKVTVRGQLVEVTSPTIFSKKLSVIVVNESLTKIVFKVIKDTGKSLGFMVLDPKSFSQRLVSTSQRY